MKKEAFTAGHLALLALIAVVSIIAVAASLDPAVVNLFTATAPGLLLAIAPLGISRDMELKDMILQTAGDIEAFKERVDSKLQSLDGEIKRIELKGNLGGILELGPRDTRDVKPTEAERKAFGMFLRTGESRFAAEAKALQVGVSGDGGYAVPTWFDQQVYSVMAKTTPLFDLVTRNRVKTFPARHIVSLGLSGSGWVGETASRAETNSPTIAIVETAGADVYCFPQATQWALDDIFFDAEAWLASEIGMELAADIQSKIVSGNGINQPTGFVAAPNALTSDQAGRPFGTLQYHKTGVAAGLPATTTALIDFLLTVVHSLNQRYRQGAVWLMNTTTLGELRKAKDTTNRPVLLDSLVTGQPATLLGYPVYEIDDVQDLAANAYPIAFGDFKRGYVLDEHEAGLRVIVDAVTNKPYVGFYSTRRMGGKPLDSNAIKLVKCAV